jgi:hypothetical protein
LVKNLRIVEHGDVVGSSVLISSGIWVSGVGGDVDESLSCQDCSRDFVVGCDLDSSLSLDLVPLGLEWVPLDDEVVIGGVGAVCAVAVNSARNGPDGSVHTNAPASDTLTSVSLERDIGELVDGNFVKESDALVNSIGVHLVHVGSVSCAVKCVRNEGIC